ncbi:MAG: NAD(+) synthase [Gemmatimonadota bacterium]
MSVARDAASVRRQLVAWIRDRVDGAGLRGAVVGLSGGIDSAVVCGLAAEALGPNRCLGIILPIESAAEDERLAREAAHAFDVETIELRLDPAFRALLDALAAGRERSERVSGGTGDPDRQTAPVVTERAETLARANLKPRLRMLALYYYANLLGYMVLGTGNRAERTVGYFTKWGDGAADAFPIADLLKHEVRDVARLIGVPAEVVERPPSAGLWTGQTDEAELGFSYDLLDRYLETGTSGDPAVDAEIERRNTLSRHKLEPPPIAEPE